MGVVKQSRQLKWNAEHDQTCKLKRSSNNFTLRLHFIHILTTQRLLECYQTATRRKKVIA